MRPGPRVKIVACVKRAGILGDDIELTADGRDVDPDYLDHVLNDWDTYAVEEAIRIRDAVGSGEVLVVTVGPPDSEEELRRCLAMGADRAVRIPADVPGHDDPIAVARALASVVRAEAPDLVLCGAQSRDSAQGATGPALGGLLDLPVVAVVTKIDLDPASRVAAVRRELEGGVLDVLEVQTPALLTVQTGINEPRYVTMRAMQEAAGREIEIGGSAASGDHAYAVRRMFVPARHTAQPIEGGPDEIARHILGIIRQAVGEP